MARRTDNQKVQRVLEFMRGVRDPEVQGALRDFGFGPRVIEEYETLLEAALETRELAKTLDDPLPTQAQQLAGRWLPVLRATLSQRYRDVRTWLLKDLSSDNAPQCVLTLQVLALRLEHLDAGTSRFGDRGRDASELLAARGFNEATRTDLNNLLAQLAQFSQTPTLPDPAHRAAIDRLWIWYLEWSAITRAVIRAPRLLRRLGFTPRPPRRTAASQNAEAVSLPAQRGADLPDHTRQILHHPLRFHSQDAVPGSEQGPVFPGVSTLPAAVTTAIHFDGQARSRSQKIQNEIPERNLPAKRDPELLPRQHAP